jgi:rhamnogalacturonan endolyase
VPANLDGDGVLDWVAKGDPRKAPGTVMLEARKNDGTFLWEYDTKITSALTQDGNGLHEGVLPWDLDRDGRDEVVTVRIDASKRPWVVALNGATGLVKSEILLPPGGGRSGGGTEDEPPGIGNHYMTIAYLDGPTGGPSVIVAQGIYKSGAVWAFDWSGGLRHRWTYQHGDLTHMGTSAHEIQAYDLDGDGKEEILFGGTILRPDGTMIWTLNRYNWGHVDVVTPGDLDPNRPGKEIFYAVEIPNADSPAVLVDAMTGNILWQRDGQHVHQGWAANIDASRPGDECRARDMVAINQIADGLPVTGLEGMWAANGTALSGRPDMHRPPEWTGDDVYDLNPKLSAWDYGADLGGGPNHGAEELILLPDYDQASGWTITVRFNLFARSYPSRWANRHYRQDVTHVGAGYGASRATFRVVP